MYCYSENTETPSDSSIKRILNESAATIETNREKEREREKIVSGIKPEWTFPIKLTCTSFHQNELQLRATISDLSVVLSKIGSFYLVRHPSFYHSTNPSHLSRILFTHDQDETDDPFSRYRRLRYTIWYRPLIPWPIVSRILSFSTTITVCTLVFTLTFSYVDLVRRSKLYVLKTVE